MSEYMDQDSWVPIEIASSSLNPTMQFADYNMTRCTSIDSVSGLRCALPDPHPHLLHDHPDSDSRWANAITLKKEGTVKRSS